MRSKNAAALTALERDHLALVKELACSICDASGPSDAHHIHQGQHFTAVALCKDCHQGARLGWHGEKLAWKVRKMDELSALNVTLRRLKASKC